MDTVEDILDWVSQNSRNLSEAQKKEIHDVLEFLTNQLQSGVGSSNRDHQSHYGTQTKTGARNQNEKKYHHRAYKNDIENSPLESKINQVTNLLSKETGYMNGKIETFSKSFEKQMKVLKDKVRELENDKIQKERERNRISDSEIDNLTGKLKSLMSCVPQAPYPYAPNPNLPHHPPPHPYDYFPSYQPHPPIPPNQHFPRFPNHPPQFYTAPRPSASSMASPFPFPGTYVGPNLPKPPTYDESQKVYRFSGNNSGSGPNGKVGSNPASSASGNSYSKPFGKPFPGGNYGKPDGNPRKKYCDPHWKKSGDGRKEHELKNESASKFSGKSYHQTASFRSEKSGTDSDRFSSSSQFQKYADRGKNKRFQQFGKNRPENHDDGGDSDTSTTSHLPPKDSQKQFATHKTDKTGYTRDVKVVTNQNSQSASKEKTSKLPNHPKNPGDASAAPQGISKAIRKKNKEGAPKTTSGTVKNENPQSSATNESSELRKLKYPSKAEALKNNIDIYQPIKPPGTCLGKVEGMPFSRPARCLKDIYDFEEEFGFCEVIRF